MDPATTAATPTTGAAATGSEATGANGAPAQGTVNATVVTGGFESTTANPFGVSKPESASGTGSAEFVIPDDYKEKPWAQQIKDNNDLWKRLAGAQELIGRKTLAVPAADAKPEDWDAYRKAVGIDEKTEYKAPSVTWEGELKAVGEALEKSRPEGFVKELYESARKWGITPAQFEGFWKDHDASFAKHYESDLKKLAEQSKVATAKFEETLKAAYGDKTEAVLDTAKKIITSTLPDNSPAKAFFTDPKNAEAAAALAMVLDGVNAKYIKEDSFKTAGMQTGATDSINSLRNQAQALGLKMTKMNPLSSKYDAAEKERQAIYDRIGELLKSGAKP